MKINTIFLLSKDYWHPKHFNEKYINYDKIIPNNEQVGIYINHNSASFSLTSGNKRKYNTESKTRSSHNYNQRNILSKIGGRFLLFFILSIIMFMNMFFISNMKNFLFNQHYHTFSEFFYGINSQLLNIKLFTLVGSVKLKSQNKLRLRSNYYLLNKNRKTNLIDSLSKAELLNANAFTTSMINRHSKINAQKEENKSILNESNNKNNKVTMKTISSTKNNLISYSNKKEPDIINYHQTLKNYVTVNSNSDNYNRYNDYQNNYDNSNNISLYHSSNTNESPKILENIHSYKPTFTKISISQNDDSGLKFDLDKLRKRDYLNSDNDLYTRQGVYDKSFNIKSDHFMGFNNSEDFRSSKDKLFINKIEDIRNNKMKTEIENRVKYFNNTDIDTNLISIKSHTNANHSLKQLISNDFNTNSDYSRTKYKRINNENNIEKKALLDNLLESILKIDLNKDMNKTNSDINYNNNGRNNNTNELYELNEIDKILQFEIKKTSNLTNKDFVKSSKVDKDINLSFIQKTNIDRQELKRKFSKLLLLLQQQSNKDNKPNSILKTYIIELKDYIMKLKDENSKHEINQLSNIKELNTTQLDLFKYSVNQLILIKQNSRNNIVKVKKDNKEILRSSNKQFSRLNSLISLFKK